MSRELRKVQRFAVQLPCRVWSNDSWLSGTVLNLSAQGCAIMMEHPPSVSTYVSLDIDLLNGEEPAMIELAGVRWISGHRFGLEYIRIHADMLMRLKAFALLLEQTP
ncbi:MAG: PilZ domain-containing protein [Nitrospira sp.]|nr:PilZ domain-containing protein [Nitrospira sp.]